LAVFPGGSPWYNVVVYDYSVAKLFVRFVLFKQSDIKLRRMNPTYLKLVDRYFDKLIPLLVPLQYSNGGPIIDFQIEDDTTIDVSEDETHQYYSYLYQGLRKRGVDALVNTLAYPTPGQIATALTPGKIIPSPYLENL